MKKEKEMREFQIFVSQDAQAAYEGSFMIEAENMQEAQKILDNMTAEELDEAVTDWEQSDYMEGIIESTKIEKIHKL